MRERGGGWERERERERGILTERKCIADERGATYHRFKSDDNRTMTENNNNFAAVNTHTHTHTHRG